MQYIVSMTSPVASVQIDRVTARPSADKGGQQPVVTPLHRMSSGRNLLRSGSTAGLSPGDTWAVLVQVRDTDGVTGVGTAGFGHPATIPVIEQLARTIVLGSDPALRHRTWELMHRSTINIARHGVAQHALSGLDIALWDLYGKQVGLPVHELLGGAVTDALPAYASWLYARDDLDALANEAAGYVTAGFGAVKQRFAFGPGDGPKGIARNVELAKVVADAIGPGVDHMGDAYMGWDLNYAVRCVRAIEDAGVRLRWIEEPLPPDDIAAMARLRKAVNTPIAAGEHEAGRAGFHRLLDDGAVDIIQPDANRLGGITEARRVWGLGETYGVEVIAHLGCAHNLHLSAVSTATPYVECMPLVDDGFDEDQLFWRLFGNQLAPVDGVVHLPTGPGLGVELDRSLLATSPAAIVIGAS